MYSRPRRAFVVPVLLVHLLPGAAALSAYGHAYSRPGDFSDSQIEALARRFPVFTVEKGVAQNVYGRHNSTAATIGTARRLKAVNASIVVLMYWNNALNYNLYECESQVQPSWVYPNPAGAAQPPLYNYSVPAFRHWWMRCAIDAVKGSGGLIDGLFLDGTPKLEQAHAIPAWGAMVDGIRAALGPSSVVIDNGMYMGPTGAQDAGDDAWVHTGRAYVERMSSIGTAAYTPSVGLRYLRWLSRSSAAHPERLLIGHGSISLAQPDDGRFEFGLGAYMLVTSSVANGSYLANNGSYDINGGLLAQPESAYVAAASCGEPLAAFESDAAAGRWALRRRFEHGVVRAAAGFERCERAAHADALVHFAR
jgi:hypothetical protein